MQARYYDPVNGVDPFGRECINAAGYLPPADWCGKRKNDSFENIAKGIIPNGSDADIKNLTSTLKDASSKAISRRGIYNGKYMKAGPYKTLYRGYDIGVAVTVETDKSGASNFQTGQASINPPLGYGATGTDVSAGQPPPKNIIATVVAPTPEGFNGGPEWLYSQSIFDQRVREQARNYQQTANRTGAPVIVVSPETIYIFNPEVK